MGKRHNGRLVALQLLHQIDSCNMYDFLDQAIADYFDHLLEDNEEMADIGARDKDTRLFAEELCRSVVARLDEIDEKITQVSENWRLDRMNVVDRNILRLAAGELLATSGTPTSIIIDEAIELAKELGNDSSSSFINGVLHKLAQDISQK